MNLRPCFLPREQGLLSKFLPSQTREESKSPQECAQSLPRHSSQHKRCNLFASPAFRHLNHPAAITAWQRPVLLLLMSTDLQFSSVPQSCPTLCDPMDCKTRGLPVHQQLPEFTQSHVPGVGDAIQPSCPLSSPSPPAFNLSQQQGLFKWVSSSHQVPKVLEFQLQHQSFQWRLRTDLL